MQSVNYSPTTTQPYLTQCLICKASSFSDDFNHQGYTVQVCDKCDLKFLNPQPSDSELAEIYSSTYFLGEPAEVSQLKQATARLYLDQVEEYRGKRGGKLLEVGSGSGDLLIEAQKRGFEVTGVEYSEHAVETSNQKLGGIGQVLCGEVETVNLPSNSFDVCILSDVIEHARDPQAFLMAVHRLLKPDGTVFLATPSLDSYSARLLGKHWMEYKPEHLFYFNQNNLQNLLFNTNFNRVLFQPNYKVLTPGYIFAHFDRYPVPGFTPVARAALRLLPKYLLNQKVKIVASGMIAIATKQIPTNRRKLSIVMPVFNEETTFSEVCEQVLEKEIPGLDIELIIVESHSTDGTREKVLQYKDHPRVRLILQENPHGKGFAVRSGLAAATGDFILIQDADLEYSMADYDELLKPLQTGQVAFVLGSRHGFGGAMKMRHFINQPFMSASLNFGHIFFQTLLNLLYGQRLKDAFTMFKVFRRDCLYGLTFESNRFDFDFELVIKLLRKGYKPLEIPVRYESRSFSEGKKVRVFRDPLTWLKALVKFRVQKLNLVENACEANRVSAIETV